MEIIRSNLNKAKGHGKFTLTMVCYQLKILTSARLTKTTADTMPLVRTRLDRLNANAMMATTAMVSLAKVNGKIRVKNMD